MPSYTELIPFLKAGKRPRQQPALQKKTPTSFPVSGLFHFAISLRQRKALSP